MIKKYSKSTEEKKEIMIMRKPLAQFKSLPAFIITIFFILLISTSFISAGSGSFFISNKSNEGQEFFSISGITGRAGIGVASPLSIFHLNASLSPGMIIESDSSQSGSVSPRLGLIDAFSVASSSSLVWYIDNYGTDFRIFQKPNMTGIGESVAFFIDSSTNNVGIGTSTPGESLEVNGNLRVAGGINRKPTNPPLFRWLPEGTNVTYTGTGLTPVAIAFDGTNMWTASAANAGVTKITPAGVMTNYTGTGLSPQGIAFDGINMWTVNYASSSVTKINPNGTLTNYTGTGLTPYGIAFDGANMWTANFGAASVTKITPAGVMTNYSGTGAQPWGIAFDGTNMWVTSSYGTTVTKITPAGAMTNYSGIGTGARSIAFDGTNIWTADYFGHSVTKITPDGTPTIYSLLDGSVSPYGIAFDGVNMWVGNYLSTGIIKVTPDGISTLYSLGGTGIGSYALAFDGTNMWLVDRTYSRVIKVLVITG